ncbi:MAG: hypothetical protein ACKOI2_13935 [Actinomycetota bacterium]
MKKALVTGTSLSLVLASCGGGESATVIPEDRLDAALLTLDDFDDEWTQDLRGVFTSRAEGPQSLEPFGWCPQAQDSVDELVNIEELAGQTGAAVEFKHARRDVRRMFHGISQQVWSNENVSKYFDVVSEAFALCLDQTWSPEQDQEVTISELATPDLGDEALSLNISIMTPGPDGDYEWASRMVIVVVGTSLMILNDLDVQLAEGEPFMTDEEWSAIVEVAVSHFTEVVGA